MSEEQCLANRVVMIIDDQRIDLLLIESVITKAGAATIVPTQDGRMAIELLDESKPDIIFCDIQMEEKDGYDFVENVRSRGEKDIPIVMVSGSNDGYIQSYLDMIGANAYIKKPITLKKLNDCMASITFPG